MLPNFLLIGAPRSGTTTLYRYLAEHPDVYMSPVKEPWYFSLADRGPWTGPGDAPGVHTIEHYMSLFSGYRGETAVGEASTSYLWDARAATLIHKTLPNVRLVVILRHPVDRAYSNYLQHVMQRRETLTFSEALRREEERLERGWSPYWSYSGMGFYGQQLQRYLQLFPRENVLILFTDDLQHRPKWLFRTLCSFLGVEYKEYTSIGQENAAGLPRNLLAQILLQEHGALSLIKRSAKLFVPRKYSNLLRAKLFKREPLPRPIVQYLTAVYNRDIALVEKITGRDLSHWRQYLQ